MYWNKEEWEKNNKRVISFWRKSIALDEGLKNIDPNNQSEINFLKYMSDKLSTEIEEYKNTVCKPYVDE